MATRRALDSDEAPAVPGRYFTPGTAGAALLAAGAARAARRAGTGSQVQPERRAVMRPAGAGRISTPKPPPAPKPAPPEPPSRCPRWAFHDGGSGEPTRRYPRAAYADGGRA